MAALGNKGDSSRRQQNTERRLSTLLKTTIEAKGTNSLHGFVQPTQGQNHIAVYMHTPVCNRLLPVLNNKLVGTVGENDSPEKGLVGGK
jgi:hypothetical protein